MKKRSLLLLLVLTIILTIPIFLTEIKPVYTQSIINPTQTNQISINLTTIPGAQVNFTVTTSISLLIEGDVSGFTIGVNSVCFIPSLNSTNNITSITINSDSKINTGIMIPTAKALVSNVNMTYLSNPFPNVTLFALFPPATETVILLSGITGFPAEVSSNLNVTITTTNGAENVSLNSATPAISLVLPNPGDTPQVINYYTYSLLLLVFLIPITLVIVDWRLKARRLEKESVEGV